LKPAGYELSEKCCEAPQGAVPGFNFNVEEWDAKGQTYETPAICRTARFGPRRLRGCDR
jgi:hypothetical protein